MSTPIPPGAGAEASAARAVSLTTNLIRQFSGGTVLTGRVAATGAEGRLQITTPHGTLSLQTSASIPPGTPVTLQLTSPGPPAQLSITPQTGTQTGTQTGAPTGGNAPSLAATAAQTAAQTASAQATTTGRTSGPPTAGQGSDAAAGRSGAGAQQAAAGGRAGAVLTSLSTGAVLQGIVTGPPAPSVQGAVSAAPQSPTAGQPGAPPAGSATGGTSAPPAPASATASAAAPTSAAALQAALQAGQVLPRGTGLPLQLTAVVPQGQPLGTVPAGALLGTVTGQTAAGQTQVATSAGTMTLATNGAPPAGTQLVLQPTGAPQPPGPGVAPTTTPTGQFAALEQALSLLTRGDGGAGGQNASAAAAGAAGQQAAQMLQALIPQPNAQMAPAMLFFMQALRGGGFERLLGGERMGALDRLQRGLGERLEGDMRGAVSGRARDGGGGEWRAYTLPLMGEDGALERIRLYMRDGRENEDSGGEDGTKGATRFIVEAHFSRLGPFQFDGLVRNKTLDLMVRTHRPLDELHRGEIRRLFTDTVSALGLGGTVAFQVVKAFDVTLTPETAAREGGMTV